jgi:hypothetical protein
MKYLLLIYEDESATPRQGDPRWQPLWDAYVALDVDARAAGVLADSQPLAASGSALRVSVTSAGRQLERGAFVPGRLQLTGYYLVEVGSEQEVVDWAARIPAAASGGLVEVRAVFEPD